MSWSSIGNIGTAANAVSSTTITITTSATAEAGNVVLVAIGKDNTSTTTGDNSEVTGVTDSAGNTYTKICEHTRGGVAAASITVSVWRSLITSQLTSGGTITASFATTIAKGISAWEFSFGAGSTVSAPVGLVTQEGSANDPASLAVSGLGSAERLYVRAVGREGNSAAFTATGTWTAITAAQSAGACVAAEFKIATSTGETSDPSWTNGDNASAMFGLEEVAAGGGQPMAKRFGGVPFTRPMPKGVW